MQLIYAYLSMAVCFCLLKKSVAMEIDDFDRRTSSNKLGFRRKLFSGTVLTPNGLEIPYDGALAEYLTYDRKDVYNCTGKMLVLTYSTDDDSAYRKLSLRHQNEALGVSRNLVELKLVQGDKNKLIIPLTEFLPLDLSQITAFIIRGYMTLHKIDLVADPAVQSCTDTVPETSFETGLLTPTRLIDFLGNWDDPSKNSAGAARVVSLAAETGPGFVMLMNKDQYLAELFSPTSTFMGMQSMAVRLVYTVYEPSEYIVTLLHQSVGDFQEFSVCTVELPVGSMRAYTIPASLFVSPNPHVSLTTANGVMVHGPLILHRIELVMDEFQLSPDAFMSGNTIFSVIASEFIQKALYFRKAMQLVSVPGTFEFGIDRDDVLQSAMREMTLESFRTKDLDVYFHYIRRTEKGRRKIQFYKCLQHELSWTKHRLFELTQGLSRTYRITPSANVTPSMLDLYKFVGRVLGMALLNKEMQDLKFIQMVYRILLGKTILLQDMEYINPLLVAKIQLIQIRQGGGSVLEHGVSFASDSLVPTDDFTIDLCQREVIGLIGAQAQALRAGFIQVIPVQVLDLFDEHELKHLFMGCPGGHDYLPMLYDC